MIAIIAAAVSVAVVAAFALIMVILRRVVPPSMVHIVQSTTAARVYGNESPDGNTYYAWPDWVPKIGVVVKPIPVSIFDITLDSYEAYDQGRLPFMVDVRAFFRISDFIKAAKMVSEFGLLRSQLEAVLQGAVRRVLATNSLEEIMQDRSKLGKEFTDEVNAQLEQWGVTTVKAIEFMDIRDTKGSNVIQNMMAKEQSRIDKESRETVANNKRAAEMAEIDARRAVEVQKQDALQQIGLRTAEQEKNVGIAKERAHQEVQIEAKTTAERQMEVARVNNVRTAEIQKEVSVVNAEAQKQVLIVKAEADKEVQIVTADAKKESDIRVAEGQLQATLKSAEGIKAEGEAKASAETQMLMAPVTAQTNLAREIGSNQGYQEYLITIRRVEAEQAVGIEMAKSVGNADLKIIANTGNVQDGIKSLGDVFTSKGGTSLGGMVSALANNPDVAKVAGDLLSKVAK